MKIRPTRAEREADRAAREIVRLQPKPAIDMSIGISSSKLPTRELTPVPIIEWRDMYRDGWAGQLVPEAFAHPAKMARGLVRKIYDTLFEMGAITKGSLVVDPFGGVGTTGIEGAYRGCQVVCVELEGKFAELATYNFAHHRRQWQTLGMPYPVVIQGDSRQLRQCVKTALNVAAIISSPPFLGANKGDAGVATSAHARDVTERGGLPKTGHLTQADYGTSEGQLSIMPAGSVDAVVSSPPYMDAINSPENGIDQTKTFDGKRHDGQIKHPNAYADRSDGQLGSMKAGEVDAVISSPPYAETSIAHEGQSGNAGSQEVIAKRKAEGYGEYGQTDGQLGSMRAGEVDAVVSSPPYADGGVHGESNEIDTNEVERATKAIKSIGVSSVTGYGDTEGQLARMDPDDTFWHAARDIVAESYALLKPGGVAVWVVKAFVRHKAIVDFPNDWRKLCEHCGFETLTEVRAMFTTELGTHTDLVSQEDVVVKKERKSFFRRLAEKKGSPRIDHETIFFMRKPLTVGVRSNGATDESRL